jgi:hypothetical protein
MNDDDDFRFESFSLVDRCPYCGAKFGQKGTTHDGKPCSHPTMMTTNSGLEGFVAGTSKKKETP